VDYPLSLTQPNLLLLLLLAPIPVLTVVLPPLLPLVLRNYLLLLLVHLLPVLHLLLNVHLLHLLHLPLLLPPLLLLLQHHNQLLKLVPLSVLINNRPNMVVMVWTINMDMILAMLHLLATTINHNITIKATMNHHEVMVILPLAKPRKLHERAVDQLAMVVEQPPLLLLLVDWHRVQNPQRHLLKTYVKMLLLLLHQVVVRLLRRIDQDLLVVLWVDMMLTVNNTQVNKPRQNHSVILVVDQAPTVLPSQH